MKLSDTCLAALFFLMILSFCAYGQQPGDAFNSIRLEPTVAYLNEKAGPERMIRLVFEGGKSFQALRIRISFNGLKDSLILKPEQSGRKQLELALPGPMISKTSQAEISLETGKRSYQARALVEPARKWTMYVLPHSHVDIGYTNTQEKILDLHIRNIDESIDLASRTASYPEGARYKWNTEASWVVENYLARADKARKDRFWKAVSKGWINLDGAYGNTNTSMTDSHQLAQLFARASELARAHGIEMSTMFQGDVPGASWGLATQAGLTGIKYFLSGPNAEDRIGNLARWQDKPFYWISPSGNEKLLFWQCQPYSIGYKLKGSKIPNFFSVDDPKPFYTGRPDENFLNPYLFGYLADLEAHAFPYDMSILTWAMSDNAPIDPELPDAVKNWNERYASPRLVICSTRDFFHAFEKKYQAKIPSFKGDYTEYWTDGLGTAARETALSRQLSDKLKQVDALWTMQGRASYPAESIKTSWDNILLFNEHTWGAYNSVSAPDDPKVRSEWAVKKGYTERAKVLVDSLMNLLTRPAASSSGSVTVYNTLTWNRTDIVYIPAALSTRGDLVKDASGKVLESQRLAGGELAFIARDIPALGSRTYTVNQGKAAQEADRAGGLAPETSSQARAGAGGFRKSSRVTGSTGPAGITAVNSTGQVSISNGIYTLELNPATGDISQLRRIRTGRNYINTDSGGFNQYLYMPGDSLEKIETSGRSSVSTGEKGPLVYSLIVHSDAPGCTSLSREIRLVKGLDKIELINTLNKTAVRTKESVHFSFPFLVPGAQVRYSIPWGSIEAEADQLPYANRNWYSIQRWIDVSNAAFGITLSSPDAPLMELGKIHTAGLLGGLHHSPLWAEFSLQSAHLYSWIMNNLWHTNFRADQEGYTSFRYTLHPHDTKFDSYTANKAGLDDHQPLVIAESSQPAGTELPPALKGTGFYLEELKPADDGKGLIASIVSCSQAATTVQLQFKSGKIVHAWKSNLTEDRLSPLSANFTLPAKEAMIIRIDYSGEIR